MTTSYYPGGGVMIATDPDAIYAELDAQDKLLWDRKDLDAIERIEQELLRRSLSRRIESNRSRLGE